jgi:hypothetical protein
MYGCSNEELEGYINTFRQYLLTTARDGQLDSNAY